MKKLTKDAIASLDIEATFRGKLWAYVPVMHGDLWALGVAVANEPGYCPINPWWCHVEMGPDAHASISAHADELNLERGLSMDTAMRVVASSMAAGRHGRGVLDCPKPEDNA